MFRNVLGGLFIFSTMVNRVNDPGSENSCVQIPEKMQILTESIRSKEMFNNSPIHSSHDFKRVKPGDICFIDGMSKATQLFINKGQALLGETESDGSENGKEEAPPNTSHASIAVGVSGDGAVIDLAEAPGAGKLTGVYSYPASELPDDQSIVCVPPVPKGTNPEKEERIRSSIVTIANKWGKVAKQATYNLKGFLPLASCQLNVNKIPESLKEKGDPLLLATASQAGKATCPSNEKVKQEASEFFVDSIIGEHRPDRSGNGVAPVFCSEYAQSIYQAALLNVTTASKDLQDKVKEMVSQGTDREEIVNLVKEQLEESGHFKTLAKDKAFMQPSGQTSPLSLFKRFASNSKLEVIHSAKENSRSETEDGESHFVRATNHYLNGRQLCSRQPEVEYAFKHLEKESSYSQGVLKCMFKGGDGRDISGSIEKCLGKELSLSEKVGVFASSKIVNQALQNLNAADLSKLLKMIEHAQLDTPSAQETLLNLLFPGEGYQAAFYRLMSKQMINVVGIRSFLVKYLPVGFAYNQNENIELVKETYNQMQKQYDRTIDIAQGMRKGVTAVKKLIRFIRNDEVRAVR